MLGCSRCRYSVNGCSRCRIAGFKPRIPRSEVSQQPTATDTIVLLHDHTSSGQQQRPPHNKCSGKRRRNRIILRDAVPHLPPRHSQGNHLGPAALHAEAFASTLQARIQQQLAAGRTAALYAATSPRKKPRGGDAGVKASIAAAGKPSSASAATPKRPGTAASRGTVLSEDAAELQSGQDLSPQVQQRQQPCQQHQSRTGRTDNQQVLSHQRSSKRQQQQQQQQQPSHPKIIVLQELPGAFENRKKAGSACAFVPAQVASCKEVSRVKSPKLTPLQTQQQQQLNSVHLLPAPSPAASSEGHDGAAHAGSTAAAAPFDPSTTSSLHTPSDAPLSASKGSKRAAPKVHPYAHLILPGVDPRKAVVGWEAPVSPFGLLEEELWQDPWRLLLGCMLLNKTSGRQVRRVFWKLLEICPTPQAAVDADVAAIRDVIGPLGLHNKRAVAVQRLSHDFMHKQWTCPTELYGIGKYAADAYYIFCRGQWQGVQPDDKDLIKYHEWLRATGGQGMALQPDVAADEVADAEADTEMV